MLDPARPRGAKRNLRRNEGAATGIAKQRDWPRRRGEAPGRGRRKRLHAKTKQGNDSAQQDGREKSANDAAQRIHLCEPACVPTPNAVAADSLALGPPRRTRRDRVKPGFSIKRRAQCSELAKAVSTKSRNNRMRPMQEGGCQCAPVPCISLIILLLLLHRRRCADPVARNRRGCVQRPCRAGAARGWRSIRRLADNFPPARARCARRPGRSR